MTHFKTLARLHRQEAGNRFHTDRTMGSRPFFSSFQKVMLEGERLAGRSSKVLNRLLSLDFWHRSGFDYVAYSNLRKYKDVTIIEEDEK